MTTPFATTVPGSSPDTSSTSTSSAKMRWANILSTLLLAAPVLATPRGMWFWNATRLVYQNEVTDLINFASKYNIGTLYTMVNTDMSVATYQNYISQCAAKNIQVQALIGDSSWATPAGFDNLQPRLDWIKTYQDSVPAASRFSAIHYDIEPWVIHPDWENDNATLTTGLLKAAEAINDFALKKLNNLPVEADVPFWAHEINCPGYDVTLDVWMFRRIAATHFMTYRNTPDALMDIAKTPLDWGSDAKKPVWLSIETVDTNDSFESYYGHSLSNFLSDLSEVESRASQYSGYAGMGIHYYEGMKALH